MPTLSERASKELLAHYGVPFAPEHLATTADEAVSAAAAVGFPVVIKLCGDNIAHKTERGLVKLNLRDESSAREAATMLLAAAQPDDHATGVLVAPMLAGNRELIAGLVDDEVFGMCVMVGVGGVLAEALGDVVFRMVPITSIDAGEMLDDLRTQKLLGEFRGEPGVDRKAVVGALLALSDVAAQRSDVRSVDINPMIIVNGYPIAVDALVELSHDGGVQ